MRTFLTVHEYAYPRYLGSENEVLSIGLGNSSKKLYSLQFSLNWLKTLLVSYPLKRRKNFCYINMYLFKF